MSPLNGPRVPHFCMNCPLILATGGDASHQVNPRLPGPDLRSSSLPNLRVFDAAAVTGRLNGSHNFEHNRLVTAPRREPLLGE